MLYDVCESSFFRVYTGEGEVGEACTCILVVGGKSPWPAGAR
jgi:hypothetical protein